MMKTAQDEFTARKDRRKYLRIVVQCLIILVVTVVCANALVTLKTYHPYGQKDAQFSGDKGFIALAYFGAARTGNHELIGEERLREHLAALKNQGYVTITTKDVAQYYQSAKELPAKSLVLLFEDGRRDTAIFAQKILEELNLKATMLTYPEKFARKDPKFLSIRDLRDLEKTTFWEMGTNGYRLAFINVFDRYNNYLGELDPLEFKQVAPFIRRNYNHYLMDYIRDEYGIPKESHNKMKARISYDYETLRDRYQSGLGYVPAMHVLMHANTGSFGNNDHVSAVNDYWIKNLFTLNFNREGYCFNQRNSSIYDLTRMQPQAYWHTNHLLMRIKYDTKQEVEFVTGDANRHKPWDTVQGALEIQAEQLILTSLPLDRGLLRLKNSTDFGDLKLSVRLKGNQFGLQKIYLRAGENLSRFVAVAVFNNYLYVTEKSDGGERGLFMVNLDRHDGKAIMSIEEHKQAAAVRELEAFIQYADSTERAKIYTERLKDTLLKHPPSISEGAAEYVPELSVHAPGNRLLTLSLAGNKLSVAIDGKTAVHDLPVTASQPGAVYLESAWGNQGWSQRNLADDVYDGVFEQLVITTNTGAAQEEVLFDGRLQGWDAISYTARKGWDSLVNWFVVNL